jgi:hypothetical protein
MITSSNLDVVEALRLFTDHSVDCAFLVPTKTGLEKSILDATAPVRSLLKRGGAHDYDAQGQGQLAKVTMEAQLLSGGRVIRSTASLYRPDAKSGDPRIWFSSLRDASDPTDLLAVVVSGKTLLVVNCTKSDVKQMLSDRQSQFWQLFNVSGSKMSSSAEELLDLLKSIGNRGYVGSLRSGDTGVGYTLETLLKIPANSNKAPDYKGVELKASRAGNQSSKRVNLFSQVPDWGISRLKSSKELLLSRGKPNKLTGQMRLTGTLRATKRNSFGLQLRLEEAPHVLHQIFVDNEEWQADASWVMGFLETRLREKHRETFWVTASVQKSGQVEAFHYRSAEYTSGARPENLPLLISTGVITLDYTIKQLPNGGVKDKGYLFKIKPRDLRLLFNPPISYHLS